MSNNKIPTISFCCESKVMSLRSEAVAVAGDVCEELVKHVVLTVPHCPEQPFVRVFRKLLSSGISRAIEAEPNPSADECSNALFV